LIYTGKNKKTGPSSTG